MLLKLYGEKAGEHVHIKFFMGPDADHLANCGKLILRIGEWQLLGACLLLGAGHMPEHLEVITEGYLAGGGDREGAEPLDDSPYKHIVDECFIVCRDVENDKWFVFEGHPNSDSVVAGPCDSFDAAVAAVQDTGRGEKEKTDGEAETET